MYSFRNDYGEGAHPKVLQALAETNLVQTEGYGLDPYCREAAGLIRNLCGAPGADVHFLTGGTSTNLVTLEALLQPCEAVIAAVTGHVAVHETGAIEATGRKVLTVPAPDGKLTPEQVESVLEAHSSEHMVIPRLVFTANTTELGTVYTAGELAALHACCQRNGLLLYLDGARLGAAAAAGGPDLAELAALTDAFYIGGTKNGALFGEALVVLTPCPRYRWYMKRRGAMLAKGRLLGVQFRALLEDGLYWELARHANEMACRLRDGVKKLGYAMAVESASNQQFVTMPRQTAEALLERGCSFEWEPSPQEGCLQVRLVTSWATPEEAVDEFLEILAGITPL